MKIASFRASHASTGSTVAATTWREWQRRVATTNQAKPAGTFASMSKCLLTTTEPKMLSPTYKPRAARSHSQRFRWPTRLASPANTSSRTATWFSSSIPASIAQLAPEKLNSLPPCSAARLSRDRATLKLLKLTTRPTPAIFRSRCSTNRLAPHQIWTPICLRVWSMIRMRSRRAGSSKLSSLLFFSSAWSLRLSSTCEAKLDNQILICDLWPRYKLQRMWYYAMQGYMKRIQHHWVIIILQS